ncbi:MAG: response regulator [Xanthomonadaceae bacterium]|jgi:two-component system OmpR family response regulator|nr:response regulator [Xanthomonadaceae bacterium]
MRILVAEDDTAIATALRDSLTEAGHVVDRVLDGASAERALLSEPYDLLVLDLGLPQRDGMAVLERIRDKRKETAVLIVTARDDVDDRIHALDLGADDYMVKPFVLAEFLARTRALLRRSVSGGVPMLPVGKLEINLSARRIWREGQEIELTAREFALLEALVTRLDQVVSRTRLTDSLSNWDQEITDNGLDISIHRLRRKLHGTGARIRTVRGLGYLLEACEDSDAAAEDE